MQVAIEIPAKALIIATNEVANQRRLIQTNLILIATIRQLDADVKAQAGLLAGLTAEERAKFNAAGGVPGVDFSIVQTLSLEECRQHLVLFNATGSQATEAEIEARCREIIRSQ